MTSDLGPFGLVPRWVFQAVTDPRAIQIYAILASYADRDRECHPKISTIATLAGCSERTVTATLGILEELGLIAVERQHDDSGRQMENAYRLASLPCSTLHPPLKPASPTPLQPASPGRVKQGSPLEHTNKNILPESSPSSSGEEDYELLPPDVPPIKPPARKDVLAEQILLDFRVFQDAYPRRAGSQDWPRARRAWRGVDAPLPDVLAGLERYKQFLTYTGKVGTELVRQPATWLYGRGWEEEYTLPSHNGNGKIPVGATSMATLHEQIKERHR